MIIENYKNLIVKKNNIDYPLFNITVYSSEDVPLTCHVYHINTEGIRECNYWSRRIDITRNTVIVINNKKDEGKIGIYYSNICRTTFLYRTRKSNKMIIKFLQYK